MCPKCVAGLHRLELSHRLLTETKRIRHDEKWSQALGHVLYVDIFRKRKFTLALLLRAY